MPRGPDGWIDGSTGARPTTSCLLCPPPPPHPPHTHQPTHQPTAHTPPPLSTVHHDGRATTMVHYLEMLHLEICMAVLGHPRQHHLNVPASSQRPVLPVLVLGRCRHGEAPGNQAAAAVLGLDRPEGAALRWCAASGGRRERRGVEEKESGEMSGEAVEGEPVPAAWTHRVAATCWARQQQLCCADWTAYDHPQLGQIEVGGFLPTHHSKHAPLESPMSALLLMAGTRAANEHVADMILFLSLKKCSPMMPPDNTLITHVCPARDLMEGCLFCSEPDDVHDAAAGGGLPRLRARARPDGPDNQARAHTARFFPCLLLRS